MSTDSASAGGEAGPSFSLAPREARSVSASNPASEPDAKLSKEFVRSICERLADSKPLRRALPGGGRIHVDRQLPFLCVFRQQPDDEELTTASLLLGEAAYLIGSAAREDHRGLAGLVDGAIDAVLPGFGGFLLIELWASPEHRTDVTGKPAAPSFRILRTRRPEISSTVEVLETALGRIRLQRKRAQVEVVETTRVTPPGLRPLLAAEPAAERGVHVVGIEVPEAYRDAETGQPLPLLQREIHQGLSRALKRAAFEFTRSQTTHKPPHYHALGRRSMVKAVWEVDRKLAELSEEFDMLLLVTPTNTEAAWRGFRRSGCENTPRFTYRPCPFDPGMLKRRLWQIPVERIEDPTLEDLFRKQQVDLDRRLTMLSDRLTSNFAAGSVALFGRPDDHLLRLARRILRSISPRTRDEADGAALDAKQFAARAQKELEHYRKHLPDLPSTAVVRDDFTGLVVSRGNLLVGAGMKVPRKRVEALIHHEVGTHIVTWANGRAQPFRQLQIGLPDYEELQEGMAVLSEYLVGGLSRTRLRLLAARVLAVQGLLDGATFQEVFRELDDEHGFTQRTAFTIAMRVFRGGGMTKDLVYLRGLDELLSYLGSGGEIAPLLVGKLGADHVGLIKELRWRKILRKPPLRPRYLDDTKALERLEGLREGRTVLDLVDGGKR